MINFVICEDRKEIRNIIKSKICNIIGNNTEYSIYEFDCFDEKLENIINNNTHRTLFIIDLYLKDGFSGYSIALKIKNRKNINQKIIFITGKTDSAFMVFEHKIKPIGFVFKNSNFDTNLIGHIKKGLKELQIENIKSSILVKCKNIEHVILLDTIVYICKVKGTKHIEITTTSFVIDTIYNLQDILGGLNIDFLKINKSIIINIKYIKKINTINKMITMIDGIEFYISNDQISEIINHSNSNYERCIEIKG